MTSNRPSRSCHRTAFRSRPVYAPGPPWRRRPRPRRRSTPQQPRAVLSSPCSPESSRCPTRFGCLTAALHLRRGAGQPIRHPPPGRHPHGTTAQWHGIGGHRPADPRGRTRHRPRRPVLHPVRTRLRAVPAGQGTHDGPLRASAVHLPAAALNSSLLVALPLAAPHGGPALATAIVVAAGSTAPRRKPGCGHCGRVP